MKLNKDELQELKRAGVVKCWRAAKPRAAEPEKAYRWGGEAYTVLAADLIGYSDVIRRFGREEYKRLRREFGTRSQLWLVIAVLGDRTDIQRFLAPTGSKSGDYTSLRALAMDKEPEAVDAATLNGFAKAAEPDKEKRIAKRKRKQKLRSARNLLKKELGAG